MASTYLLLDSLLEIGRAVGLEYTDGFAVTPPSVLAAAGMKLSS